jgi:hypothetical protein
MDKRIVYGVGGVAILGALAGVYFAKNKSVPIAASIPAAVPLATPVQPRYPVPGSPEELAAQIKGPLPSLDQSDGPIMEQLIALFGKEGFDAIFNPADLLKKSVVTIANADDDRLDIDYLPFNPLKENFKAIKQGDHYFLDPKNYERYDLIVKVAEVTDTKKIVAVYLHFYPLIQSAYQEISDHGYFNDRLIKVIDSLLSVPEVSEPLELVALVKSYKFLDKKFEKLTGAQKMFMRMGPENVRKEKRPAT